VKFDMMLITLAWKNIWRNRLRSLIIICAIAVGLTCGLVVAGYYSNIGDQIINSTIDTQISHMQISDPRFLLDNEIKYYVPDAQSAVRKIDSLPQVIAAAPRIVINAMAASAQTAIGVQINGVIPEDEKRLTTISQLVVEGRYFEEGVVNSAVIGMELARKLDLELGMRIVLTFTDENGAITGSAFRISGLYRTASSAFDRSMVYVRAGELGPLLAPEIRFQQIAVRFTDIKAADTSVNQIKALFSGMEVRTWREISPMLDYMSFAMSMVMYALLAIILFALSFGIVNTMLMVVLERRREFGMLMAVGMKRMTLFLLVVSETIALSLTGAAAGMTAALGLLAALGRTGIDLGMFSEGMREFGIAEVLYPSVPWVMYPGLAAMVILAAVISAVYPALMALKLKPAEAMRG